VLELPRPVELLYMLTTFQLFGLVLDELPRISPLRPVNIVKMTLTSDLIAVAMLVLMQEVLKAAGSAYVFDWHATSRPWLDFRFHNVMHPQLVCSREKTRRSIFVLSIAVEKLLELLAVDSFVAETRLGMLMILGPDQRFS